MTFEDKLRNATRTSQEIKQAERDLFTEKLTQTAHEEVERFKNQCAENAKNGLKSCSVLSLVWINHTMIFMVMIMCGLVLMMVTVYTLRIVLMLKMKNYF